VTDRVRCFAVSDAGPSPKDALQLPG
jgi:hypothetical protein